MHVTVVGNKGMLARDLAALLDEKGISQWGADLPELDITQADKVYQLVKGSGATVVINCAAYTAVDKAESQPDVAYAVNRDGVRNLAMVCRDLDIPLVHVSTDYVFDGKLRRPYLEDDPPCPLGVYGESKWAGENELRSVHRKHIILRTSWLFGAMGNSFVKTILRLARERNELRVVDDQFGCPTWTGDFAEVLIGIVKAAEAPGERQGLWGTYHYCGLEETTWCGFAAEIIEQAKGLTELRAGQVTPITTAEFPTAAGRPPWSVLDCGKIKQQLGILQKSWRDGLSTVIRTLVAEQEGTSS
ncbi:MAG: dTDP-4-dehydrorhamnose reductase [Syntrophobacteraceae bacterium]